MCLAKAYMDINGERGLLLEEVTSLEVKDDRLLLKTLFGEQKEIEASIKEIDFLTHNIILASSRG